MTVDQAGEPEVEGEVFIDLTDAEAAAVGVEPAKEEADAPNHRDADDDDADNEGELTAKQARRRAARQRQRREREELAERLAAAEAQTRELQKGMAHLMAGRVQSEVAAADAAFAAAERELQEAVTISDPQAITAAHVKLTQAIGYRDRVRAQAASLGRPQQQQPEAPQQPARTTRAAQEWRSRHSEWFTPEDPNEETEIALAIDRRLSAEDLYDVGSAEYMAELDRRIARRLPDLIKPARSQSRAPPVSGGSAVSTRRVALDPALVAQMREFGLDPTNKDHVKDVLKFSKDAA